MGKLHDQLKDVGYTGTALEAYLVRLLFILFADDSTIFQKGIFFDYIDQRTREDGSDLAMHLDQLFQVLDTPEDKRLKTLDEQLNLFPYVNGRLFSDRLPTAAFTSQMRQILLDCCKLDWGKISPAIFGSLFQSVMDSTARRNLGAHYTSEKNIMKLIKPLFLDELWEEFHSSGENHNKLRALHGKISKLRFLDPACGCGNFLITAYRELRMIELAIVEKLLRDSATGATKLLTNINQYFLVDLDQFYGIELGEFPSQIAQVAMFLIDHQCNMMVSDRFGEYIPLIPLQKSAIIVNENALRLDWQSIIKPLEGEVEKPRYHYILGNPPFVGKQLQDSDQKADIETIFACVKGSGVLDYVSCWYVKAAAYMNFYNMTADSLKSKAAFVSTNSICQGEQVGVLWSQLFQQYKTKILFAHQTFKWGNEAKNNAAVHVVIIGFSNNSCSKKYLFEYSDISNEPLERVVSNISPYLVEGSDTLVIKRKEPICNVPKISFGSMPNDGGWLLLDDEEKVLMLKEDPSADTLISPMISAHEFLNGETRWCLWLKDVSPAELRKHPLILDRVAKVREHRNSSNREATKKLAATPTLFGEVRQPISEYILIPLHSSETRKYIPLGFFPKEYIANNSCSIIPDATRFHFGILHSEMHMTWVKYTCGRIKSDYRYSNETVYNNYPWPEAPTDKQKQAIEAAAQSVLDVRAQFPDSNLADLYDPNTMPSVLVKAHQHLDKAVDLCYRPQPFTSEAKRIEYLFELYEKYTGGLFQTEKKNKKKPKNITDETHQTRKDQLEEQHNIEREVGPTSNS